MSKDKDKETAESVPSADVRAVEAKKQAVGSKIPTGIKRPDDPTQDKAAWSEARQLDEGAKASHAKAGSSSDRANPKLDVAAPSSGPPDPARATQDATTGNTEGKFSQNLDLQGAVDWP
jgi:hypothetical protein